MQNASDIDEWPENVSSADFVAMALVPVGTLLLIAATLRRERVAALCWPHTTQPHRLNAQGGARIKTSTAAMDDDYEDDIVLLQLSQDDHRGDVVDGILSDAATPPPGDSVTDTSLQPGQTAGDYHGDWTRSFDAAFVWSMVLGLVALAVATSMSRPDLWTKPMLWAAIAAKFAAMTVVSMGGHRPCDGGPWKIVS